MKKFAYIISMVFSLFLATACDDNDGPNDGPIEPVTEVRAESFIGSVNVYFKAPQNENYYYTLITYDDSEGKTKHLKVGKEALDSETGLMKAVVTGFTDTNDHNFKLQACTAHGSVSTPVAVTGKAEARGEAKNYVLNSVTMYPGENCAVINWQNITGVPVTLDIAYYRNGVPVIVTRDATSGGSVSVEITEPTTIYYQTYNTGDDQDKSEAKSMDITPIPCPYDIVDPNVEYITLTNPCNQMSWVLDPDTPDNPYAFYITSTGGDPFSNAAGLRAAKAGTKFVMRYKANKDFILELFWCDKGGGAAGGRSTTVTVPKSDGWSTFIHDYADAMDQHNWKGNAGDFFRMDWGTESGLEIHAKNMHFEK